MRSILRELVHHGFLLHREPQGSQLLARGQREHSDPPSNDEGERKRTVSLHLHILMHFNNLINIRMVRDTEERGQEVKDDKPVNLQILFESRSP